MARRMSIIFYPDDYNDCGYTNDDSTTTTADYYSNPSYSVRRGSGESLLGRIANIIPQSTLARLASAFSPPGYDIALENMNDVKCLNLDYHRMDIETMVCDVSQCSSLVVPMTFPEECAIEDYDRERVDHDKCDTDRLQECILRNVERLDAASKEILQERHHTIAEECETRRTFEALRSLNNGKSSIAATSLPAWWEHPTDDDAITDCDLMRHVLNGNEIRKIVRELVVERIRTGETGEGGGEFVNVREVKVDAVGPAGVIVRVIMSPDGGDDNEEGGNREMTSIDMPIQFVETSLGQHYGGTSIRKRVLTLFS